MKRYGIVFFILLCALVFSFSAGAASRYVIDNAEVFFEEEIEELDAIAAEVEEQSGLRCVFLSGEYLGDLDPLLSVYAGDAENLSLFMLDMGDLVIDHYQYNATYGESAFRLSNRECADIRTTVLAYINDGDCVRAAKEFFALSAEYFNNDENYTAGADGVESDGETGNLPDLSSVEYVIDGASLFDESEIESLNAIAAEVEARNGLRCIFLTGEYLGSLTSSLRDYAGDAEDLSLLAVDMGVRHFDHYQYNAIYGESAFRLNNRETDDILDSILPYMADGDYVEAAETFISLSAAYFDNDENFVAGTDGYGEYGHEADGERHSVFSYGVGPYLAFIGKGALIGLAVGAVVALIIFGVYKRKVHGNTYPLDEFTKLKLTAQHDNFLYKNVVATKIESSSGSSGGGRSSGGGGGHSGGRSF